MINISATIAGTIAASGEEFSPLPKTPVPLFVNGAWWAFQQQERPTAPKYAIISRKSVDNGNTWAEDSTDYFTAQPNNVEEILSTKAFGNGVLAGTGALNGVFHKDLDTPASSWGLVDSFNDIPPTTNTKVATAVAYDNFNDNFVIHFFNVTGGRWHFVTTTDFVSYVDAGASSFGLGGSGAPFELLAVLHFHTDSAGLHVVHARFAGSGNAYGTWTSADLVTWSLVDSVVVPSSNYNFRDIRYFKGQWVGTRDFASNGVASSLFRAYYSTDLVAWAEMGINESAPDLVSQSFQAKDIVSTNNRMAWIDDGELVETTNGTSSTRLKNEQRLAPDVTVLTLGVSSSPTTSRDFNVKGNYVNHLLVDGPTVALQTLVSHEELGGRIIKWTGDLTVKPSLAFPVGHPKGSVVGFTGEAKVSGTGIADEGFSVEGTVFTSSFDQILNYAFNDGIRQWETTITGSTSFALGMIALVLESGAFGNRKILLNKDAVSTDTASTPVIWNSYDGMTIGVVANIPAGTIQFYVDGVLIIDFAPVVTGDSMWSPIIDVFSSHGKMAINIGQGPFAFPIAGTIPWASEYL